MFFKNMCPSCPLNGTLSADCAVLTFTNGAVWKLQCVDPPGHLSPTIRTPCSAKQTCCAVGQTCARTRCIDTPVLSKIHVVYMTHLDLGFTNSTRNVCDTYFNEYFPAAFATADQLRRNCSDPARCPVFRWTEFPVSTASKYILSVSPTLAI
jgi:hypothetical protein